MTLVVMLTCEMWHIPGTNDPMMVVFLFCLVSRKLKSRSRSKEECRAFHFTIVPLLLRCYSLLQNLDSNLSSIQTFWTIPECLSLVLTKAMAVNRVAFLTSQLQVRKYPRSSWYVFLNETQHWLRRSTHLESTGQTNLYSPGWGAEQDRFISKFSFGQQKHRVTFC